MGLLATFITAIVTIVGCALGGQRVWGYYPGKWWSWLLVRLFLLPVTVEGREKIVDGQSYIFCPNHQGAFDIFLLFGYLGHDFRWMLRKGLRNIIFIGPACERAGHIFVDSHGTTGMMHTFRQALNTLKGGTSIIVFPEGTRTKDGHLHTFKRGAYTLAAMLKVPVVPLTLDGPYQVNPKGSKVMTPHRLKITIHKPLAAVTREEGNDAGVDRLLHESQKVIAESLGEKVQD